MDNTSPLVAAMAAKCRAMILNWRGATIDLPAPLQPRHLAWMCARIEDCAEVWPAAKSNRWIGFVQGGMMANRMLDLDTAKSMFDEAKTAHGGSSEDLLDHLDPASSFELDIGGEG